MTDYEQPLNEAIRQGFTEALEVMGIKEALAIVQDLAYHTGPIGWDAHGRPPLCLLCASPGPGLASLDAHQLFCPWRRAREWVAANNVSDETEG